MLIRLFAYKDDCIHVVEANIPAYDITSQLDYLNKLSIPYLLCKRTNEGDWFPLRRFAYKWSELQQYIGEKPMKY